MITGAGQYAGNVSTGGISVTRAGSGLVTSAVPGVRAYNVQGVQISGPPAGAIGASASARARPSTADILEAVQGGLASIGELTQGLNARDAAGVEADFLELQARQEEISRFREQRDLDVERNRFLARSRAALAAQGADTASGSALSVLTGQRQEYAIKSQRLLDDSIVREKSLKAKAANTRTAGKKAFDAAIFGAAGKGLSSIGSLL